MIPQHCYNNAHFKRDQPGQDLEATPTEFCMQIISSYQFSSETEPRSGKQVGNT